MKPRIFRAENLGDLGIRLSVYVAQPTRVLALFDRVRIQVQTAPDPETWATVTTLDIVDGTALYVYTHASGTTASLYRALYMTTDDDFGAPSPTLLGSTVGWISIAEAKAAGVPSALSDEAITEAIVGEQSFFEEQTGTWFEPRAVEATFDGNGQSYQSFHVPILEVGGLYVNSMFDSVVPADNYSWRAPGHPQHHVNPRIALKNDAYVEPWARTPGTPGYIFGRGVANQKLVCVMGFLQADGSPPFKLKQALARAVSKSLGGEGIAGGDATITAGVLTRHEVKDHVRVYSPIYRVSTKAKPPSSMLITGDSFIDGVLRLYKRGPKVYDSNVTYNAVR